MPGTSAGAYAAQAFSRSRNCFGFTSSSNVGTFNTTNVLATQVLGQLPGKRSSNTVNATDVAATVNVASPVTTGIGRKSNQASNAAPALIHPRSHHARREKTPC